MSLPPKVREESMSGMSLDATEAKRRNSFCKNLSDVDFDRVQPYRKPIFAPDGHAPLGRNT
jgi:hypothetical protein